MLFRLLRKLLSMCLLLLCWVAAAAAAPSAAGTQITNMAEGTYTDAATGLLVRLTSNTVNTAVAVSEALTLTASQGVAVSSAASFVISHTLTNTGNATTTYLLTFAVVAGGTFTPLNLQLVQDLNGNGRVDPGEPVITTGATVTLAAGASANLLLWGQVPASATAGQTAQIVLTATSQLQGATASNTDKLTVSSGAALQVTLGASSPSTGPGAQLIFTAAVVNSGNVPAMPAALTVDGVPASLFLLSVAIPAQTSFVSAQPSADPDSQLLFHLQGAASTAYVSLVPAGSVVDGVAWAIASLAPGRTLQGQFTVGVNGNAAGIVSAIAYANWTDQGVPTRTPGNLLLVQISPRLVRIAFFTGSDYATLAAQNALGQPLFVQVDVAICDADRTRINTVPVTLTSQLTGDTETFTAVETGLDTGLFRILPDVPTANAAVHLVASGNGVLEVLRNDVVTARITTCSGVTVNATTSVLIDPSGVVFDSGTNLPVAGATVQLIDASGAGRGPAAVLQRDGVTPAPSQVVTGADGAFSFPLVSPGNSLLGVSVPAGFSFPSVLVPERQPVDRQIDVRGSYGKTFTVGGAVNAPVRFDVPVDAAPTGTLFIQKTANKATAEVGDFVNYTIKLNNLGTVALAGTVVNDLLPAGFAYVRGTARLNNAPLPEPIRGTGSSLQFALGSVPASAGPSAGAQPTLTYRVRVGAGSQGGNGVNTAQAVSGALQSNRSSVKVQLVGGVFSNKGYLIGKVYANCSKEREREAAEPGIPGVRIYLEDGTYAVTDEEGKYSLYGLTPRTHVAKVDSTTLPAGASLQVLNNRNAMDGGSRFVDFSNGELQKADFAVAECDTDIREQIAARREALSNPSELLQAAGSLLASTPVVPVDARTLPASGPIGLPGALRGNTAINGAIPLAGATLPNGSGTPLGAVRDPGGSYAPNVQGLPKPIFTPGAEWRRSLDRGTKTGGTLEATDMDESADESQMLEPLENLLPDLSPELGFIGLHNGQTMSSDQTRVRVKGPVGSELELMLNDQPVPASQVGKKSSLEKTGTQAWEYIGVNLKPGRNTLSVSVLDSFGNQRNTMQIFVLAPGKLAKIDIEVPEKSVADGATALSISIRLSDAQGLPVAERTPVTLKSSLGQWQTPDLDPRRPGTQVFVEGGEGNFLLLPPSQPGKAELGASSGTIHATEKIEFTPNLRPMIAAGIVEGTLNLRNLNASALRPTQSGDVFERQIQSTSRSLASGKGEVAARTALFLKGKVLGSTLLTLSYDSDKPADTALFRDIQPNQFYPVYGDSSARGFDAQSTGKLYVMLQSGSNYALLGDYSTQSDDPTRQLTQYSRALNGVKGRLQEGQVTVEGFASRTSATQTIQEFRANGTSGPFLLNINGVVNSQQIDVITRNRNQPSVIVKDTPLAQFTDYEIEPYSGRLLLKDPVPSVDADLNPVFIRVNYSVDSGGPKHLVAGADVKVQISPELVLGATAIRDADPVNSLSLAGVSATAKLGDSTSATVEVARSRSDIQGGGAGQRVEIKHEDGPLQARVWGTHTDAGFYNPNSLQSAGQSEYGAKAGYVLDEQNRLVAEALKTSNSVSGAKQTGMELKLEHSLSGNSRLEVGVRYSNANAYSVLSAPALPGFSTPVLPSPAGLAAASASASAQVGYTSARVKLTVPVPELPQAEVYGLAEYAIDGSGGREIGVGGTYAVNPTTKLYLRHDFINSLNGPYTLNPAASQYSTVAGINTELADSTQLFNEYRIGDSINGRGSEAAIGLRRLWRLDNGIGLSTSVQRIKPVSGVVLDDSTAATIGLEYTAAADWKASGQAQWQTSSTSRSWLLSGALASKLDESWTLLNRGLYSVQINLAPGVGERKLITAQSGFAYRPVDADVWNALGRIEYKRDLDSSLGVGLNRDESSWIVSSHLNVQPNRSWLMTGRVAAKWATDRTNGIGSRALTKLLGARSTWDITERWDVGLQGYRMWGDGAAETAVGVEVGYLAWKNMWLSAGYNLKGFRAADLAGDAYTQRGVYLRMRFKFDENVFDAGNNTPIASASPVKP
ncbi:hypothetical protein [Polaromonas sp.]|uniref:hypothetical protein n=1 Tax=Polaromonas sp. TaxID=1869339 RepID=UPI00180A2499|nr:hypothetical protein [Polaromonas sp.]NML85962.1 DUF11 domain-containing protein [Polaromonas sp.]